MDAYIFSKKDIFSSFLDKQTCFYTICFFMISSSLLGMSLENILYSYGVAISIPFIGILQTRLKNKLLLMIINLTFSFGFLIKCNFFILIVSILFALCFLSHIRQIFNKNAIPVYLRWIPSYQQRIINYNRKMDVNLDGSSTNNEDLINDLYTVLHSKIQGRYLVFNLVLSSVFAWLNQVILLDKCHFIYHIHFNLLYFLISLIINFVLLVLYGVFKQFLKQVNVIRGDQNNVGMYVITLSFSIFMLAFSFNCFLPILIFLNVLLCFNCFAFCLRYYKPSRIANDN
jgi:hypothetical protein